MSTYEFVCDDQLIYETLSRTFGYESFRENQLEVIKACLEKKDALAIMPTGSGKSLCYQLPAVLSSKITFIVSPLISLMEDQMTKLINLNIPCAQINSVVDSDQIENTLTQLLSSEIQSDTPKIIFTTPESLEQRANVSSALHTLVQLNRVERFVVDEVHCLSQWGHDFRESYLYLQTLRELYPTIPCTALTASATETVKKDIMYLLAFTNVERPFEIFTQSFFRHNLNIHVRERAKPGKEHVSDIIRTEHRNQCGIVYCLSRKNTEETAVYLRGLGMKAAYYHAGMSSDDRSEVQHKWQSNDIHVMVATIAFGMGIDKANVRFVIHQEMPHSIAEYYQEIGRAGRDGKSSQCYLFYQIADKIILEKMMRNTPKKKLLLHDMMNFIENNFMCRHRNICCEFEEFLPEDCETSCDICSNKSSMQYLDITHYCEVICQTICELKHNTSIGFVSQVVRNAFQVKEISNLPKLEHLSNKQIHHIIQFLIVKKLIHTRVIRNTKTGDWDQILSVYAKFQKGDPILMPTVSMDEYSINKQALQCPFDIQKKPKNEIHPLYQRLQRERIMLSKRHNSTQLYRIASNKSLQDMVDKLPITTDDLLKCQGIGKERAKKYGSNFIRIIKEYRSNNHKVSENKTEDNQNSIFEMIREVGTINDDDNIVIIE